MKILKLYFQSVITMIFLFTLTNCEQQTKRAKQYAQGIEDYISAYTSEVISVESGIRIVLSSNSVYNSGKKDLSGIELFEFKPSIKGKAVWLNERTIEFVPDKKLQSGKIYHAFFNLYKLENVPKDLKVFEFEFQTIKQSFSYVNGGMKSTEDSKYLCSLQGSIVLADVINDEDVEKIVSAKLNEQELKIRWGEQTEDNVYNFSIDSLKRTDKEQNVVIDINGKIIGVDFVQKDTVTIPSVGKFEVVNIKRVQKPSQHIEIFFSDPLKKSQNLDGLITLSNGSKLRLIIEDNEIQAYPVVRQTGQTKLNIEPGVKSAFGKKIGKRYSYDITFDEIKPALKAIGNGVIMPNSEKLIYPFEAVNLKAVDLEIVKIYENDIAQFLQVNDLSGYYDLNRVGRPVLRKTIKLVSENTVDFKNWNTFSIDLTGLIEKDPGAIYRVILSFRKNYSLYSCGDNDDEQDDMNIEENDFEQSNPDEENNWNGPGYYSSYYYHQGYNWREQNNPCHVSYYTSDLWISRNILASDLGIIAKSGSNNSMVFAVTNLNTTEPVTGAELEIFNFQNQLLGTIRTDENGFAKLNLENKPFLLVAKKGKQRGYLRLDDGSSLSLSKFDVSGKIIGKGLKAYIYGERGVWRPGDTLFLTCILEDKNKNLPELHPVIFELFDPQGQLYRRINKTHGVNGFYCFKTATDPEAKTGNWTAKIKVGGTVFSKRIKIETIKPNRLKIDLDFGVKMITADDDSLVGKLSVRWLFGAIAKNLKSKIDVRLQNSKTTFEGFKNYIFTNPARKFDSKDETVFDGKINNKGEADISVRLSSNKTAPGMLKAQFSIKVFEEGGDFSIDNFSIPYSPYKNYVGIKLPEGSRSYYQMLQTDTLHKIKVATVDESGKPVSVSDLKAKIYKVNWRWWWNSSDDDMASYIGRKQKKAVIEKTLSTKDGRGSFDFEIKYPNWGRYFVEVYDPESGHSAGKSFYVDWPEWVGRGKRKDPEAATMLTFSSDKKKYEVGETAKISFPSGGVGRALVSVESGTGIIQAEWIILTEKETVYNLKITDEMAPNVYVNISLVQPHAQTVNDLPIRLYGLIPILVENPETILHPLIDMPSELKPEEDVKITVSEKNGKAMTYTIAVVDEGLLDLTRFKTPDPWHEFYAREALGVKTWDMYDMVIGAYGGNLGQIFAVGGDESLGKKDGKKANRFKPVVKFMGPYVLEAGSKQKHIFKMPNYIGSVKTMLVAGNDGAYGSAEKTTLVKKPLMILATLPRVLGPGESVKLPVSVFAMKKNIKNVEIKIELNDFFSTAKNSTTISFDEPGEKLAWFDLNVAGKTGIGKVKIFARSGSKKAEYDIEIDIRNPNPPRVKVVNAVIEPQKTWEETYRLFGTEGTNSASLDMFGMPPFSLERRLQFLHRYPFGCAEQITSAVFPQLLLDNLMELSNDEKIYVSNNIKTAIYKLRAFQSYNGGVKSWPTSNSTNDWVTSYVGHFLLEAEKRGYDLPINFKEKWLKYQRKTAGSWSLYTEDFRGHYINSDIVQAYRLFTLALSNKPLLGAMNRMREIPEITTQSRWLLAAAYSLAGQTEVAKELTSDMSIYFDNYHRSYYSYGSRLRDEAITLYTLCLMNEKERAIPLMQKIAKDLNSTAWYSTQTTAFSLIALSSFIGDTKAPSDVLEFSYSLNKGEEIDVKSLYTVSHVEMDVANEKSGNIKITNSGKNPLFAQMTLSGIPETGDTIFEENNLKLSVKYKYMNGNKIDVSKIYQGTDFKVEVTITNPGMLGAYENLALTQIFPSGWEIINMRLSETSSNQTKNIPIYQNIRDDRVYTFFDLNKTKSKTFVIFLNASYLGRFYLPSVSCEEMYDNSISARVPGKWVEVIEPGE